MTTLERYPELQPAYDELQKISLNSTRRSEYDQRLKWYLDAVNLREGSREEGIKRGLQKGKKEGLQQGVKEGAFKKACETALKLKEMGLSADRICEATELLVEVIEAL